jgi:hypothetical protein
LGNSEASEKALIDTGAPRSVFPLGAAIALEISLPDPVESPADIKKLKFLGQDWQAFSHEVTLSLPPFDDLVWHAEVDLVLQEGLKYGLLGHEGFLDRWAVSFNAYHNYFVVEPVEEFHKRMPIDVFEVWQREGPGYN